jgi:hypothetical protein
MAATTRNRSRSSNITPSTTDGDDAQVIVLPDEVFRIARARRERKASDYQAYAKTAATVLGMTFKTFDAAFSARLEQAIEEERENERRGHLDTFRKTISQYKLPANLKTLKDKARAIAEELSSDEAPVFVDLIITDEGLDVAMRRPRRPRNPDAEVGERSRISSWEAYQRGQKDGDTFKVEKLGIREYRDENGNSFSNLTAWLAENQPDSHAAAILRKYGQI